MCLGTEEKSAGLVCWTMNLRCWHKQQQLNKMILLTLSFLCLQQNSRVKSKKSAVMWHTCRICVHIHTCTRTIFVKMLTIILFLMDLLKIMHIQKSIYVDFHNLFWSVYPKFSNFRPPSQDMPVCGLATLNCL